MKVWSMLSITSPKCPHILRELMKSTGFFMNVFDFKIIIIVFFKFLDVNYNQLIMNMSGLCLSNLKRNNGISLDSNL